MENELKKRVIDFTNSINDKFLKIAEEYNENARNDRNAMLRETGTNSMYQGIYRSKYGNIRDFKKLSCGERNRIKDFYKNRPKGFHVDHIIPLSKGGKHRLYNLQYLPAFENIRKKDKLPNRFVFLFALYLRFRFWLNNR